MESLTMLSRGEFARSPKPLASSVSHKLEILAILLVKPFARASRMHLGCRNGKLAACLALAGRDGAEYGFGIILAGRLCPRRGCLVRNIILRSSSVVPTCFYGHGSVQDRLCRNLMSHHQDIRTPKGSFSEHEDLKVCA